MREKQLPIEPVIRQAAKAWSVAGRKQRRHLEAALELKEQMEYLDRIIREGHKAVA